MSEASGGGDALMHAARHLKAGLAVPDIELPTTRGGTLNLGRLRGWCVAFVYPWTGRPGKPNPPDWDIIPGAHGSTPEAMRFGALYPAFRACDVEVCGISGQDSAYQAEFARRTDLPFVLLSDAGGAFRDALGLPTFETGGVRYLRRLTLVTRDGHLAETLFPVPHPERHADEVLDRVRCLLPR